MENFLFNLKEVEELDTIESIWYGIFGPSWFVICK